MEKAIAIDNISRKIYEIRGVQVMFDSDLAELYHCKNGTKDINKAVKRNIERFPNDFYFELSKEECLRFQIGTLNKSGNKRGQHIKYLPHVFTEQGVAMLATVLKTDMAAEVSVKIMRAFILMRRYISNNLIEQKYINNLVFNHEERLNLIESTFNCFDDKKTDIYFCGQIYDAYNKIQDICNSAKEKIIIIDSYADNILLDIIKRLNIKVIIITKDNNYITNQDIEKYNSQYHNLTVIFNNNYHDRFFIVDDKLVYHCGASINRIGYKTFAINIMDERSSQLIINDVIKLL